MGDALERDRQRYLAAAHAVQTGVAYTMARQDHDPQRREKHLRTGEVVAARDLHTTLWLLAERGLIADDDVATPAQRRMGINAVMVSLGALVALLVQKGVFGDEEYMAAIADGMEAEQRLYERELGAGVHLA